MEFFTNLYQTLTFTSLYSQMILVYIYLYMHKHIHICIYTDTYSHTHIYTYMCVYIYIYTHTYIYNQYAFVYTQSCPTLCSPMTVVRQPPLSMEYCPGKNTGMGCHFLLQGIFPTQGSCVSCTDRQILYHWATWEYIYIHFSHWYIYIYQYIKIYITHIKVK